MTENGVALAMTSGVFKYLVAEPPSGDFLIEFLALSRFRSRFLNLVAEPPSRGFGGVFVTWWPSHQVELKLNLNSNLV